MIPKDRQQKDALKLRLCVVHLNEIKKLSDV